MSAIRNSGERPYRMGHESLYLGGEEDQEQEILQPVFHEHTSYSQNFPTKNKDPGMTLFCASFIAINLLNTAHNECVEQDDKSSKGLKIFAIEIGLFAATFLLAPVEIITRIALGIILAIPLIITHFTCDKDNRAPHDVMVGISFLGALLTFLGLAHGAISTYTNLAYSDREIDYSGQYNKFIG